MVGEMMDYTVGSIVQLTTPAPNEPPQMELIGGYPQLVSKRKPRRVALPECPIAKEVMLLVAKRAKEGMKTFGQTMERDDKDISEWIDDAIEEALDLACYLTRIKKDL